MRVKMPRLTRRSISLVLCILLIAACSTYLVWTLLPRKIVWHPANTYITGNGGEQVTLEERERIGKWVWHVITTQKPLSKNIQVFLPNDYYVVFVYGNQTGEVLAVNYSHGLIIRLKDSSQFTFNQDTYMVIDKE